ncbi:hypothetical protein MO973_10470 [Paenibacillus sp. TRM 82003]|nr:hypothetical protein [Paenibacillus sp. TRM 82003]
MLLYELTRLVEEGRTAKDVSKEVPDTDVRSLRPRLSEAELIMEQLLRREASSRETVGVGI